MRKELYAIYDKAAETFTDPAPFINEALAKRAFSDLIAGDGVYNAHPDDFDFYLVGYYDVRNGCMLSFDDVILPKLICRGTDYVEIR